jgi:hypothetical protein
MKIIKYLGISLLVVLTGCRDEFIEAVPQGSELEANYYQTEDQIFKGLIAAYDPLQWTFPEGAWTSTVMLGEIRSDNANAGGDPSNSDQPGWQQIDDFNNNTLTLESTSFWKRGWWGVYRTNLVINNENVQSDNVNIYKAEAKFLRAFYHFDLFNIFGPVPVLDFVVSVNDYTSVSRATVSALFEFITTDLEEAIAVLPEQKFTGGESGRVSKTTAQALLGKVYLYWADIMNDDPALFDQAAVHLKAVINSGQYTLTDDYAELFGFGVKNNDESVFEIQFTNQVPAGFEAVQFIDGNMMTQLCGIRGLCLDHPDYIPGWGFMLPTQDLNNHFFADDDYRRDAAIISLQELSDVGCAVTLSEQNNLDFEGLWQQKYANFNSYTTPNGGEINVLKDPNQPVIRLADVLLMAAEALVRGSGADGEAIGYINQVRERAAGPGDNTGNFRTVQDIITDEGLALLDVIWYERRAELAGEGDRWFDLVRSGRATNGLFSGDKASNFNSDELYLAIPQIDIDNSAGNLTAYPTSELFQ